MNFVMRDVRGHILNRDEVAAAIKRKLAAGLSGYAIARELGISPDTVYKVRQNGTLKPRNEFKAANNCAATLIDDTVTNLADESHEYRSLICNQSYVEIAPRRFIKRATAEKYGIKQRANHEHRSI